MDLTMTAAILAGIAIILPTIGRNRPQLNMEEVFCRTGTRILTPEEQDGVQLKLIQAGLKISPEYLYGLRASAAAGCILLSILLILISSINWIALALLAPVCYMAPEWWVKKRRSTRQSQIKKSISDFSKMFSTALSAGAPLILALSEGAKATGGPLRDEVTLTIKDHNAGKPIIEALFDMAKRTDVEELNSLVRALNQASTQGAPLAETMANYSEQTRMLQKHETMEQAGKLSVKMVPPVLIFVIVPILMVIGYPAVYALMQAF